jgi:GntR family transcriptional regulator/MocR family aminotransferase
MALWSRHVAKHWRSRRDVALGYGDVGGYPPLRRAIAAHLRANRGIAADPAQIFVVGGAQQGFQLIASMLLDPGDKVWFENPGAIGARNCFAAAGAELVPCRVDGEGLVVEDALRAARDFRLAFVTPSHQQPLGSTMSLARRLALIAAADAADAWVVEDDYDGEFRYRGRPPPTVKSIDLAGRVIYVGTFSKTLFPALRLGYIVAPPRLTDVFTRFMQAFFPGAPSNPQAVVAEFIDEGHFAAHIRRMRKLYAERHDALVDAARGSLGGLIDLMPTYTGLHLFGRLHAGIAEEDAERLAAERNITVAPLGRYTIAPIADRGLVLGYSGVRSDEIRRGVSVLRDVLEQALPKPTAVRRAAAARPRPATVSTRSNSRSR